MGLMTRIKDVSAAAKYSVTRFGERTLLAALKTYYAVYELFERGRKTEVEPESKPLRNPVHRLVEFYVALTWPGDLDKALPLLMAQKGKDQRIIEAIHQIWAWSNWAQRKQYAVRETVLSGDFIVKIVGNGEAQRVWFQIIDGAMVTDIIKDDLGNVTFIRIDIQKSRYTREKGITTYWITEVWDEGGMRSWEHDRGIDHDLTALGNPSAVLTLEEAGTAPYLPFVHAPFRDTGEKRGMNCFYHAVPKIDEVDALVSRLHRMIFRYKKPIWAVQTSGVDANGRPIPPIALTAGEDGNVTNGIIKFDGEPFLSVPGTLNCLVPDINLGDARDTINDQVEEIEKDCPELLYYRIIGGKQEIATETLRLMLGPAIARVQEFRGNLEAALVRADKLALLMAQNMQLQGFSVANIGGMDAWDHTFAEREVLPLSRSELANAEKTEGEADRVRKDIGLPLEIILQDRGYTQEEIDKIKALKQQEDAQASTLASQMMDAAMRKFDQGAGTVPNPAGGGLPAQSQAQGA